MMFTGLIERVGILGSMTSRGNGMTVRVKTDVWDEPLKKGESIAVNGACLTASAVLADGFEADVLRETVERTSLSAKRPGARLNLERALRSGDRIGGHMVSGHVDGLGTAASIQRTGTDYIVRVSCGEALIKEIVTKGSIALDGISLTVSATGPDWFEVHIIPHTWAETSLSSLRKDESLNIETDMIAKYVRKFMDKGAPSASILDKMQRAGFPLNT